MNILVIGGSGFIGTNLVRALLARGDSVTIFDKRQSNAFPDRVILGDVRDPAAVEAAMEGAEAVFNLAAEHRDDVSPVSLYYEVNVEGARHIANAASRQGVEKLIFTSSVAVYGLGSPLPDENSRPAPFNDYGRSKLLAEEVFAGWKAGSPQRALTIVRPVVVFGEGNRGNVYNLMQQVRSGRFLMVGSGKNRKSMAYVGNVAAFLVTCLGFGPGIHLYNYADKPDLTTRALLDLIRSELHIKGRLGTLPYPVGFLGGLSFDLLARLTGKKYPVSSIRIRKFCAETTVSSEAALSTGFSPPFTIEGGLRRMMAALDEDLYFTGGG